MAILRSKVDVRDPSFEANVQHHRKLSESLRQLVEAIAQGRRRTVPQTPYRPRQAAAPGPGAHTA